MLCFDTSDTRDFWSNACRQANIDSQARHFAGTFSELTTVGDETVDDVIEIVDSLTQLAHDGQKRGTAHMQLHFEHEGIRVREPGDYWIVTNSVGKPACIVQVTNVAVLPFEEVGDEFADSEGEGDLTLEYWREAHKGNFIEQGAMWGETWRDDMPIVCESFELVYKQ